VISQMCHILLLQGAVEQFWPVNLPVEHGHGSAQSVEFSRREQQLSIPQRSNWAKRLVLCHESPIGVHLLRPAIQSRYASRYVEGRRDEGPAADGEHSARMCDPNAVCSRSEVQTQPTVVV